MAQRYAGQIRQLEEGFEHMERKMEEERDKEGRLERECLDKMALVKKDYDVLYDKYLKYKNMALLMHPKEQKH